jgi:hypothetical protein
MSEIPQKWQKLKKIGTDFSFPPYVEAGACTIKLLSAVIYGSL